MVKKGLLLANVKFYIHYFYKKLNPKNNFFFQLFYS